jgi:hypothetical protein
MRESVSRETHGRKGVTPEKPVYHATYGSRCQESRGRGVVPPLGGVRLSGARGGAAGRVAVVTGGRVVAASLHLLEAGDELRRFLLLIGELGRASEVLDRRGDLAPLICRLAI